MRPQQERATSRGNRYAAIPEKDDLPLVMREIAQTIGGCATALTMHPSGQHLPSLLFIDRSRSVSDEQAVLRQAADFIVEGETGAHAWMAGFDGADGVLLIPVEPIPGHSRLVISVFFSKLTAALRHEAESIYLERRPFAVGYFRLWQVDRMRRQQCQVLESALHQSDTGVILLARGGEMIFANDAAELVFAKGDGLCRKHGFLNATNLSESVSLQVAINHLEAVNANQMSTVGYQSSPVLALHRESGPPLIVSLLAAETRAIEPGDAAVILHVVDPQLNTAKMLAPVCRLYRLSPVETDLVCHLAQGKALSQAAELMHVKEQTARSYMKQIFLKTDTNRQTELVVLMLSSLVRMKEGIVQEALSVSVRMNGRYSSI